VPLIVDEAWGAHLPFHPNLPTWAMDAGADVCVTSVHKLGSGLEQGSVFHGQGGMIDPAVLESREGLLGMHVHGRDDFCGPGRATDLDPLQIVVDVTGLGTTGYRIADWLREHHRVNLHLADHRRISVQLTHADDKGSADRLLTALCDVPGHARQLGPAPDVEVPDPRICAWSRSCCPVTPTSAGSNRSPGRTPSAGSVPRCTPRTRPAFRRRCPGSG
jgi:arginine/lysine/ornithine decarboxylase